MRFVIQGLLAGTGLHHTRKVHIAAEIQIRTSDGKIALFRLMVEPWKAIALHHAQVGRRQEFHWTS
jgi:hypothetical protein